MKPLNPGLSALPTTIFTVMSALAAEHGAINLGQGFPDTEGPDELVAEAARALSDPDLGEARNQYPPLTGLPVLREAVAAANRRFYGLDIDPAREVVVTSGATEALAAALAALIEPGDEVVVIEPLYDTYLPTIRLLGGIPRLVRLQPPDRTPTTTCRRTTPPGTRPGARRPLSPPPSPPTSCSTTSCSPRTCSTGCSTRTASRWIARARSPMAAAARARASPASSRRFRPTISTT